MIQELTEHDAVKEVKHIHDEPQEHAVAVRGEPSYSDPSMKLATGNFTLPQGVLELVQDTDGWQISKMQFRTSGDYQQHFTFRISRVEG